MQQHSQLQQKDSHHRARYKPRNPTISIQKSKFKHPGIHLAVPGHHRRRCSRRSEKGKDLEASGEMGSKRSMNGRCGYWTNEKHVEFLNSMEASFVREMLQGDEHRLPRLDRYLPDTSDSTQDLKNAGFSTSGGSSSRGRNGSSRADKKASRSLSSQPYNSSDDQVVPQVGDKVERDHSRVPIFTAN